ncbi:MAG: hypothetical protein KJO31_11675 [Gammaproteobacteria bacterium]|nr:hypothetical protein [Gammaproteobacteria bacterium]
MDCCRWGEADLQRLIQAGQGERIVSETRFRCRNCRAVVDKQVRPPVPQLGGSVAWVRMASQ